MKKILAIAFVYFLAGCATGMSYHSWDSTWQLGYTDTQLSENVYRVSYAGYNIPQNQCDDFAIMRASEIARQRGYKFFRIVSEKQSNQTQTFYMPGATQTTGTVASYGNVARVNATSYSSGFAGTINRPVSTFTVELLKDKVDSLGILDAEVVWNSLAKTHGIIK